jgi:hypothetical protein
MAFQRLRIINLDSSNEDSDNSSESRIRTIARRIKKMLVSLKGKKLDDLDIALLKGVIFASPNSESANFKQLH